MSEHIAAMAGLSVEFILCFFFYEIFSQVALDRALTSISPPSARVSAYHSSYLQLWTFSHSVLLFSHTGAFIMVQTRPQSSTKSSADDPAPPPAVAIFLTYLFLGTVLSFCFGRDPGAPLPLADELVRDISPTMAIISLFLVSYSLFDVMAVGAAKQKYMYGFSKKKFGPWIHNPPEEVYLALRAQTNQVEQLPGFLIGSIFFSILVNGTTGAILSLVWAVLRRLYASRYRSAAGKTIEESGIATYTIPAYFALNAMLMGTTVQCLRISLY